MPLKKGSRKMPPKEPMHKMPGGMMMADKDMMMAPSAPMPKKMPPKKKGK